MSNQLPKAYQGVITNFGVAPYQHDEKNSQSYFVDIKQPDGTDKTIWAIGLREHMEKGNYQIGDQVNLIDLGTKEGSKRKEWEVSRYEPNQEQKLNSIEPDFTPEKVKQAKQHKVEEQVNQDLIDKNLYLGEDLPSSIKNNYVGMPVNRFLQDEKINYYDRNDQSSVAFEDRKNGLHTSRSDERTVKAMIDLAESKGWSSIKLKGTEEFKKEAWLEASIRGIETKGYNPTEKDLAELKIRQESRTNNQVTVDEQRSLEINANKEAKEVENTEPQNQEHQEKSILDSVYTKEEDKTKSDHVQDAGLAVAMDAGLAMATGGKYTAGMAVASVVTDKVQSLVADKIVEQTEKYTEKENLKEASVYDYNADGEKRDPEIAVNHDKETHQTNVNKSLDIKKEWYQSKDFKQNYQSSYERGNLTDTLKDNYYEVDSFKDVYLSGQLKNIVSTEADKYHQGIDKSSNSIFLKSTIQDISASIDDQKISSEVINQFNNRHSKSFEQSGDFENMNFRTMAVLTRHDLDATLSRHNIENKDDLIKEFDRRVIDYSYQVQEQEKNIFGSKQVELNMTNNEKELSKYFDNIGKYPLDDKQLFAIEAWRRKLENDYQNHPDFVAKKLDDLNAKIPDIASGKFNLPDCPQIKVAPEIEVQTKQSEQTRSR